MYDEFFSKSHEFVSQGLPFATALIVRAEKPTSGKPGDKAIITPSGTMYGWIGGSCAQPTVIEQALKAMADGESRLIRLSVDPQQQSERDGVLDLPMTCFSGGTLEIFIEPQLPLPRLLVIGSLPVAQSLVQLGKAMNYRVIAVDPDHNGESLPEADELITDLENMAERITPLTYVVVASHGNFDELALQYALQSRASYVALVTSQRRASSVLEYLTAQGLTEEALSRLKYPAGLDIQARRGDEIALSIMAEIVQRRRNAEPIEIEDLLDGVNLADEPAEAIDPICGMSVTIDGAEHTYEYNGQTYYFCCGGCKENFAADPAQYLDAPSPSGEAIDPICKMTVDIASAKYMTEFDGELYYFCCAGCKVTFDKAPEEYLAVSG